MEYLQQLTNYLVANLVKKEELNAWAEDGELLCSGHVVEDGFEVKYICNFEMSDVDIEPIKLFMLVASWLGKYTPERDSQGLASPMFFTERLHNGRYDLGVKIEFQEQYNLVESENGEWDVNGTLMTLESDFHNLLDADATEYLVIVDAHTQDNALKN